MSSNPESQGLNLRAPRCRGTGVVLGHRFQTKDVDPVQFFDYCVRCGMRQDTMSAREPVASVVGATIIVVSLVTFFTVLVVRVT